MTFDAWTTATSRVSGRKAARTSSGDTKPCAVAGHVAHLDAGLLAQRPQRPQHRVVIADRRHHVIARPHDAANRQIQHVGAVRAEDDLQRIVGADQLGDALPGPFDDAVGFHRLAVAAAAVRGADLALVVVDGRVDRLRLGPAGGGVVEIDAVGRTHQRCRIIVKASRIAAVSV